MLFIWWSELWEQKFVFFCKSLKSLKLYGALMERSSYCNHSEHKLTLAQPTSVFSPFFHLLLCSFRLCLLVLCAAELCQGGGPVGLQHCLCLVAHRHFTTVAGPPHPTGGTAADQVNFSSSLSSEISVWFLLQRYLWCSCLDNVFPCCYGKRLINV